MVTHFSTVAILKLAMIDIQSTTASTQKICITVQVMSTSYMWSGDGNYGNFGNYMVTIQGNYMVSTWYW